MAVKEREWYEHGRRGIPGRLTSNILKSIVSKFIGGRKDGVDRASSKDGESTTPLHHSALQENTIIENVMLVLREFDGGILRETADARLCI